MTRRLFGSMLQRMAALPLPEWVGMVRQSKSVEIERKTERCWRNPFRAKQLVAHWCPRYGKSGLFGGPGVARVKKMKKARKRGLFGCKVLDTQGAKMETLS
jgi:hypothetical protein